MKYLLDTCLISELVKKKPNQKVIHWIESCDEDYLYLSVLTIGEIQKGISKLKDSQRKITLQVWLDKDLIDRFKNRIVTISYEVAAVWGQIQGEAELKGEPIPTIDGLLGATAITYNLTIVTRNEMYIKKTGARILNPWKI